MNAPRDRIPGASYDRFAGLAWLSPADTERLRTGFTWTRCTTVITADIPKAVQKAAPQNAEWCSSDAFEALAPEPPELRFDARDGVVYFADHEG
ncbi:hypothetical protein [Yinghuangia seranimata]|uniref:hypothetical protein n=1 Tax=Yinghuangia seranimata TaxID=408067 RepID=UPI00248CEF9C|nr:hypothetical protein [Yinghuangia seranimata]MDI2124850.1 hypothetical protein [Yinghuangia seranimata]